MNSAAVPETKTAAQTGPLRSGETEYHSSGVSECEHYNVVWLTAIEKRFPIIARHVGFELAKLGERRRFVIDFGKVNSTAIGVLPSLLARWLPDGRRVGHEWVCRNPRRADRKPGSFRVNMNTGKWADFATGDRGGDVISLTAYLAGTGQAEAARALADMLGVK